MVRNMAIKMPLPVLISFNFLRPMDCVSTKIFKVCLFLIIFEYSFYAKNVIIIKYDSIAYFTEKQFHDRLGYVRLGCIS